MSESESFAALMAVFALAALICAWFATSLANYYRNRNDDLAHQVYDLQIEIMRLRAESDKEDDE
jgi:hypothetical protein